MNWQDLGMDVCHRWRLAFWRSQHCEQMENTIPHCIWAGQHSGNVFMHNHANVRMFTDSAAFAHPTLIYRDQEDLLSSQSTRPDISYGSQMPNEDSFA